jgi:2-keto-3-deoxy-L-rhamnonate aldolase RhmA
MLGTFVKSGDPTVTEILASSGFDFLIADLEHSSLAMRDVENIVRAAALHSVPVLVRIPPDGLHQAGRALDAGAVGIQISDLVDRTTAQRARSVCSYPPAGARSMSLSQRGAQFGQVQAPEHLATSERDLVLVGQVESVAGTEALPLLLAESLVDLWFIGSLDLSVSLGHAGSTNHPTVADTLHDIAATILAAGARLGVFAQDVGEARLWVQRGATMVAVTSDYALLATQARRLAREWHEPEAHAHTRDSTAASGNASTGVAKHSA